MIKEVKYNGYSAKPSDYDCPDGDLGSAMDIVAEDGCIKTVSPPEVMFSIPAEFSMEFIHTTNNFQHYILLNKNDNTIWWIDYIDRDNKVATLHQIGKSKYMYKWENVGNGEVFYTEDYMLVIGTKIYADNHSTTVRAVVKIAHVNNDKSISIETDNELFNGTYQRILSTFITYDFKEIYQINAVGNTLLILTDKGINYLLWESDKDDYYNLGHTIPELPISFGLSADVKMSKETRVDLKIYLREYVASDTVKPQDVLLEDFSDENMPGITEAVMGQVNRFIAEEAIAKGRFVFPFFVRYAYRLYDGTLTMHSAPILMVCSTENAVIPFVSKFIEYKKTDVVPPWIQLQGFFIQTFGAFQALDFRVEDELKIKELKNWSDIIDSVDIFISKPIYTFDQGGKCKRCVIADSVFSGYSVCKNASQNDKFNTSDYPIQYQRNPFFNLYSKTFGSPGATPSDMDVAELPSRYIVELPQKPRHMIMEDIRNCSQFFKLRSIKIGELKTIRTTIPIEEKYLNTLLEQEPMSDDYDSHDKKIPDYSYVYNQRLNISGIKKQIFSGFRMCSTFEFTDGLVLHQMPNLPQNVVNIKHPLSAYVYIKQDGKQIIVHERIKDYFGNQTPFLYFYYPNPNAYKVVFDMAGFASGTGFIEVPLRKHSFLNGAFYWDGWKSIELVGRRLTNDELPIQVSSDDERKTFIPNKIYTSDINNPYIFPVLGINTIGMGKIIGLNSATKAISEGQFGQFPLYAFTTDGVWALEVSANGFFSAKQPVTRDICTNPASITSLDDSVIFATDRGIMILSGANSICISDIINDNGMIMKIPDIPQGNTLIRLAGYKESDFNIIPFRQFIKECMAVYDYINQRIYVYNAKQDYAYIYSMESKAWGMAHINFDQHLNSYPESIVVTPEGEVCDLSVPRMTQGIKGIMQTRPLKLDMPDTLKTVTSVIQRGYFKKGHVKVALYGSRDLLNWHLVGSSQSHILRGVIGSPYKYFRLVSLLNLDANESVSGCSIEYTPKMLNKTR